MDRKKKIIELIAHWREKISSVEIFSFIKALKRRDTGDMLMCT